MRDADLPDRSGSAGNGIQPIDFTIQVSLPGIVCRDVSGSHSGRTLSQRTLAPQWTLLSALPNQSRMRIVGVGLIWFGSYLAEMDAR